MNETKGQGAIDAQMQRLGAAAVAAARTLALASAETKTRALEAAARELRIRSASILAVNAKDMDGARAKGETQAFLDRLALDVHRIDAMARGLEEVARLPDPIGTVLAEWTRPNGLRIERVRVPLGVIGIIYESRPNVTADAGGLCIKSGNAVILRGGAESFQSSRAIVEALVAGLRAANLPEAAVQLVPTADRAAVGVLLGMTKFIDVIVPRGGKSLIERVQRESRIPVLAHLEGLCATYVDGAADLTMARKLVLNAKMRRTGVCGATETLLVDRRVAASHLGPLVQDLLAANCEVRGDEKVQAVDSRVKSASEQDFLTEFLDAIIAVQLVDGVAGAIAHINAHGSHHTDAIITEDAAAAEKFLAEIDSGIVLHNASTQYADGGEFGMGAEIGIATGKLHARGPVGAEQLTIYKYRVRGSGQCRP